MADALTDLDSIMDAAKEEGQAARAAASPPPAEPPASSAQPTPPAEPEAAPPTPKPEPEPAPDPGAPAKAEPKPEPTPADTPKPPQPPAAPEPPAPTPEPEPPADDATMDQLLKEFAEQDRVCLESLETCNKEAAKFEEVKAELASVEGEITKVDQLLNPPKVEGIEPPELDEFQKAQAKELKRDLREKRDDLVRKAREHYSRSHEAANRYTARLGSAQDAITERHKAALEERDYRVALQRDSAEFKQAWDADFEAEFAAANIRAEERDDVAEIVKMRGRQALEANGPMEPSARRTFIKQQVQREAARIDRVHRAALQGHADGKRRDSRVDAPAPAIASGTPRPSAEAHRSRESMGIAEALDDIISEARQQMRGNRAKA